MLRSPRVRERDVLFGRRTFDDAVAKLVIDRFLLEHSPRRLHAAFLAKQKALQRRFAEQEQLVVARSIALKIFTLFKSFSKLQVRSVFILFSPIF